MGNKIGFQQQRHLVKRFLRSFCFVTLNVLFFGYITTCLFMWHEQRYLMYHPNTHILAPGAYGLEGFTDTTLHTSDGTSLDTWIHPAKTGYPFLIFFHGTGGNMSNLAPYFKALVNEGFGLLAIDYRGFGASTGAPSENGIYEDASTAIKYAHETLAIPLNHIVLYGESLGTGVAVQMATQLPVAAIILQSPYASIIDIGYMRYPWLPVNFLLEDKFNSISKIKSAHAPILFMHGDKDTVVPMTEGKKLFAAANEPKQAVYFPGHGHNDLDIQARLDAVLAFSKKQQLLH